MNKTMAKILAYAVPTRSGRRWLRAVLQYGVIRAVKTLRLLQREKTTPPRYYFTVCAAAKDEGEYFEEWIEWHKKMGVEKFYIYDNESTDNTKDVLAPYIESGLVEYTFWKGKGQQMPIYNDCLDKHRIDSRWIAFIDLDEFIVPIKDKNVPEFLKRFEEFSAIEINWLCYGSGGAKKKEAGRVMDRFKHHAVSSHYENQQRKSVVDPRRVLTIIGAHEAARISGQTADTHGNPITTYFRKREPQHNVIRINHYAVKSHEEFTAKRARGRISSASKSRNKYMHNLEYFNKLDLNDVLDETDYEEIANAALK